MIKVKPVKLRKTDNATTITAPLALGARWDWGF
jgi:hypothetical protein